jgi:transposase
MMTFLPTLKEHYRSLLKLPKPWIITDIVLAEDDLRVDITIEWPVGRRVPCPECGKRCAVKDHATKRIWRHLDLMQFKTYLHCSVPRCNCPIHEALTIAVPWAEARTHWTLLFEAFALRIIEHTSTTTKACGLLGLTWHQVHVIKKRAVERGLERRNLDEIEYLGIDEKSFGRHEKFITTLSDLSGERVIEVAPSKSNDAAREVFSVLTDQQRECVKAVAMDMSAGYETVSQEKCPNAESVYDKFHVEKTISTGVDKVRRIEHGSLLKEGITIFVRTKYLWLRRPERWSEYQQEQFRQVEEYFGKGKVGQTRIGRAWTLKESFRGFWNFAYPGVARRFFRRWYYWATHSKLSPMIKAAKTLDRHLEGMLAYFRHGITNAFVEGMNSKIQDIKSAARGFRNFENYRIAILFACGKLHLQP